MKSSHYMKVQVFHFHVTMGNRKQKCKKGKVNMQTLLYEISKLLEEKNKRIEMLEWQLEKANEEIEILKKSKIVNVAEGENHDK